MHEDAVPPIIGHEIDAGDVEVYDSVDEAAGSLCGGWLVRENIWEAYDSRGHLLRSEPTDDDRAVVITFDPDVEPDAELLSDLLRYSLRSSRFCQLPDVEAASLDELIAEQIAAQQRFERTLLSYRIKRFFGRVRD